MDGFTASALIIAALCPAFFGVFSILKCKEAHAIFGLFVSIVAMVFLMAYLLIEA